MKKSTKSLFKSRALTIVIGITCAFSVFVYQFIFKDHINLNKTTVKDEKIINEKETMSDKNVSTNVLKNKFPGVGLNGLNDAISSIEVCNRLANKDYSPIDGKKVVFLTFDDGPSLTVTPKILKVLKENDVRATFFVIGRCVNESGERSKKILKDCYEQGNAIGNHSYSHDYNYLYPNKNLNFNNFVNDYKKNEEVLKDVLGDDFSTKVWRCPGGTKSWGGTNEIQGYSEKNNIALVDWDALNKDAVGRKKYPKELFNEAVKSSLNKDMVVLLMHDTYGMEATAKYLDSIIKYYKDNGYIFKVLG